MQVKNRQYTFTFKLAQLDEYVTPGLILLAIAMNLSDK